FLRRPMGDRLAHGPDLALQLIGTRVLRNPAGCDMRGRYSMVVAAEESEEILSEVILVGLRERAHDAEVEGDVFAVVRGVGGDEDVARMHVGVEEAVAEHLREKDLDAGAGEAGDVDVVFAQSIELVDRYARHP